MATDSWAAIKEFGTRSGAIAAAAGPHNHVQFPGGTRRRRRRARGADPLCVFLCDCRKDGMRWSYLTAMTLQYSDAGISGDQLNTLAPDRGPKTSGNVQVSPERTRVPVGNTDMRTETGAGFAL
jgi:hypothetical protein